MAMPPKAETVRDRLDRAKASGDLNEIKAALEDVRAAGVEASQIDEALAEIQNMEAAGAQGTAAGAAAGPEPESNDDSGATTGGAPDEAALLRARAEALKKLGNERLKGGTKTAAREALECFTSGLEICCSDAVLNAQLHGNRAHVRMLLRQFVEAIDDCRKAIELDPKNVKYYWRAAKASAHLELHRNALDFCERGLEHEPKNADLLKQRDACAEKLATQQQRRSEQALTQSAAHLASDFNADEAMAVQDKVNGLNEQIEQLRVTIATKQRERMKAVLTRNNITETPAETKLFGCVGRCFLQQERGAVEQTLNVTIESLEVELPKLDNAHKELEKRKDAAEKELKEIIDAYRRSADANAAAGAA